jgi:hypothetical protein
MIEVWWGSFWISTIVIFSWNSLILMTIFFTLRFSMIQILQCLRNRDARSLVLITTIFALWFSRIGLFFHGLYLIYVLIDWVLISIIMVNWISKLLFILWVLEINVISFFIWKVLLLWRFLLRIFIDFFVKRLRWFLIKFLYTLIFI